MYEFVDRPVTSLDHGGRFLIGSMRSWVRIMSENRCPQLALCNAFAQWRMVCGLQPFLRMMALFNRHGRISFGFCPLHCNHVSEGEAIILNLVCFVPERRPDIVRSIASRFVED